ncbi:hypothetical protein CEXT_754191 [Caerostris extrusa]|uniref:Uncharacterized protein n=1 Tax=Caerostris extrusa TaxID=172846 RepID=A0AAV4MT17_CAEEX|nr:hypothetical protein CEXT_754191 [Caerostris extrusa]
MFDARFDLCVLLPQDIGNKHPITKQTSEPRDLFDKIPETQLIILARIENAGVVYVRSQIRCGCVLLPQDIGNKQPHHNFRPRDLLIGFRNPTNPFGED